MRAAETRTAIERPVARPMTNPLSLKEDAVDAEVEVEVEVDGAEILPDETGDAPLSTVYLQVNQFSQL